MAEGLSILQALVLGVVQGITEWLPVSSSGHLVIVQETLGLEATLFLDLLLHVGTLLVVLVFYRGTVAGILTALVQAPGALAEGRSWRQVWLEDPHRRLALLVVVGSVPTAIIGFAFEDVFVGFFSSLLVVGAALIATGTSLMLSRLAPEADDPPQVGWGAALAIGALQGLAIIPGISRSGATIGGALLLGVERELAVRFSFLLSVPAILGATILQADGAALAAAGANLPAYAVGVVVSMLVGYGALALLVYIVKQETFHRFAWYCWPVGGLVLWLAT